MKLMSMLKFVYYNSLRAPMIAEYVGNLPNHGPMQAVTDYETVNKRNLSYADLLSLLPEIWMFVPCKYIDGAWVVLEKPNEYDGMDIHDFEQFEEYRQAKSRCLFEGFKINKLKLGDSDKSVTLENELITIFWHYEIEGWTLSHGIRTIEDLTKYDLELSETAEKQII